MELNKNIDKTEKEKVRSNSASPFVRSTKLARSPNRTQVEVPAREPEETVAPIEQQPKVAKIDQLLEKLEGLVEFVMSRTNIHSGIRMEILQVKELLAGAKAEEAEKFAAAVTRAEAAERRAETSKSRAEAAERKLREKAGSSQPTPLTVVAGPSAVETPPGTNLPGTGKRRRGTPEERAAKKAKKKKDAAGDGQPPSSQQPADKDPGQEADGWRKVEGRKKKGPKPSARPATKPRKMRQRPEALVIGEVVGTSYADILRKVKEDPSLKELGEKVVTVRRTMKGNLLFELDKDQAVHSADYKAQVEKVLGETAKVRALSQEVSIVCRGMDEITTAEDLRRALEKDLNMEGVDMSISMRGSYNQTQAATIRLPAAAANKALQIGKVKVGWTRCALSLPVWVVRCFKCMGFDHYALKCKGPDRSDLCWRCGGKGHIAKDCSNAPKCLLCPTGSNDHPTGGGVCPAFKKAKDGRRA